MPNHRVPNNCFSGKCPITEVQIFSPDTVQYCLTIMSSCGMYDASGDFCFHMGFPAKSGAAMLELLIRVPLGLCFCMQRLVNCFDSGVGGSLLLVIPNRMGICTWSPKLNGDGNSVIQQQIRSEQHLFVRQLCARCRLL